ncbi:hypothetical protein M405DRAFT_226441 [Rhizopogon salebrosus TDB-379]|nr:hypothetical protein M405DRAFT_226441 [Rhizopogon salebrosus TDB-379]
MLQNSFALYKRRCYIHFVRSYISFNRKPKDPFRLYLSRPQNNKLAATSTFPPAASSVLIAISRDTPSPMSSVIADSGCRVCAAAGRVAARGVGAEPSVFPPPGNDGLVPLPTLACEGCGTLLEEPDVEALGSSTPESIKRACSGSSCSERKRTSRPWMRSTDFSRSIQAWCAFNMSSPRRRSTSRPLNACELLSETRRE